MTFSRFAGLAAAVLLSAGAAQAHPRLMSVTPAGGASVAAPKTVVLTFSETLVPAFSGADVTMLAMPGMGEMAMTPAKTAIVGKTLTLNFAKPLPAAGYRIDWHVVAADTHRITGKTSFSVR